MAKYETSADKPGSHHLTRENVAYTIQWLREIETGDAAVSTVDWRTESGILASMLDWLTSQLDHS